MTTVQQIYEEMQRIAPLALAESWDILLESSQRHKI